MLLLFLFLFNSKVKYLIINRKCLFYSDAVRKNSLTQNETDDRIETVIKDWLKYASDRDGGRKKRKTIANNTPERNNTENA